MTASAPTPRPGSGPVAGVPAGLRSWQVAALRGYESRSPRDFLVTATPGAGKTTFGLTLAARLLAARAVDRVIVVAPTDHLRTQWADAAARLGLTLDPTLTNAVGPVRPGTDGYVTTYAQVAARPLLHRRRTEARRALVILDEVHHAGDSLSWGDAVAEAFDPARRRLSLTGTPFRTNPTERIPFVRYEESAPGELVSVADYAYGYREALGDRVVRPVVFAAYAGTSRWLNSAGEVLAATLGDDLTKSVEDTAWRTALDPEGDWVPHVIAAVDDRVTHLREHGVPDAAGLLLASDQESARAYARIARSVTGQAPVLILSDDPKASRKIEQFAAGTQRLAVCVRMVSEGVDIPRASVLGFLTSYRTPLFFAQAVGRVVRARHPRESATVFLPAVRPLLRLAAELEEQRDHVVRIAGPASDDLDDITVEQRERTEPGGPSFTALGAEAEFAHVLHGGRAFLPDAVQTAGATAGPLDGPAAEPGAPAWAPEPTRPLSAEDEDFLGLPGLLSAEQTAALLASRDADLRKRASGLRDLSADGRPDAASPRDGGGAAELAGADGTGWRAAVELRREVNRLVAQVAARSGRSHAEVHVEVRRAVPGPPSAAAPPDLLAARRDYLLGRVA